MEDLMQRYDPELLAVLQTFPSVSLVDWDDLPTTRVLTGEMLTAMMASIPDSPNVAKEDRAVPGPENAPEVPVRIYRPVSNTGILPGLFWIHGGASAGGGLAAGLVLLARDRGEVPVSFQLLLYPMIDNRNATESSEEFANAPIWSRRDNQGGWQAYLGDAANSLDASPYAAASRAINLANLPPTFIAVGSLEVFLGEDVEYALRLAHAGVPVELHVYPCAFHGFDGLAPATSISQRFVVDRDLAITCLVERQAQQAPACCACLSTNRIR